MFSSLVRVFLLALFALAALAAPEPFAPTRVRGLATRDSNPIHVVTRDVPLAPAVPLTNAQRLARGLPPNRPRSYYGRRVLQPRQSSTCQQRRGTIQIVYSQGGAVHTGFLSSSNSFGEFQPSPDPAAALMVSVCAEATIGAFDIATANGFANFPYLAAILGFADTSINLGRGSYNYAYIGASTQARRGPAVTQPNSFSAAAGVPEGVETNVWRLSATSQLLPSWVNADGSEPAVQIVFVPGANAFAFVGDLAAFTANFGEAYPATFTFIPAIAP